MKRLLILGMLALLAATTGCRTCSSWFNRGADCDTCVGEPVRTYSSGVVMPQGTIIQPGPAELLPPGS